MKEHASTRAGIAQRAWALLLAVALCLGLVPGAAWAAEGQTAAAGAENAQASAGTVTLTVTAGSKNDYGTGEVTYPTWVNKQYALGEVLKTAQAAGGTGHGKGDLTMEDLLDTAVAKGDLKAYDASESSYGKYLNSVTSKDGAKLAGWSSDDSSAGPVRQRRLCELFVRPGQACRREFLPILLGFVFFGDRSVRLESVLREESCRPGEGRRWLADFRGCDPDGHLREQDRLRCGGDDVPGVGQQAVCTRRGAQGGPSRRRHRACEGGSHDGGPPERSRGEGRSERL